MGKNLSPVDCAWLHMEEPGNLMNVTGLFLFEGPLRMEALRARIRERLLPFEPFHCRILERTGRRPRWEPDPDFDLDRHLVLANPQDDLMGFVSELLSRPLDRSHPLWQFHCLETGSGWAMVARLHHVIGDGVALMHVMGRLADRVPQTYRVPRREGPPPRGAWLRSALDLIGTVVLSPEPRTGLKGALGQVKRAVVSPPFELERLRQIRAELGCTVNDLLLDAVTSSLRSAMDKPPAAIRAVMPVNLRRPEDEQLGNRFGLAFVSLPVGEAELAGRLQALRAGLARLKGSLQPLLLYAVLYLAGLLPRSWEAWLVRFFGTRATAVVTNVPGPSEPIEILEQPLRDLMFWVPQSGRLALGISLISYAGRMRVGVAADAGVIPHPERIVQNFENALEDRLTMA